MGAAWRIQLEIVSQTFFYVSAWGMRQATCAYRACGMECTECGSKFGKYGHKNTRKKPH